MIRKLWAKSADRFSVIHGTQTTGFSHPPLMLRKRGQLFFLSVGIPANPSQWESIPQFVLVEFSFNWNFHRVITLKANSAIGLGCLSMQPLVMGAIPHNWISNSQRFRNHPQGMKCGRSLTITQLISKFWLIAHSRLTRNDTKRKIQPGLVLRLWRQLSLTRSLCSQAQYSRCFISQHTTVNC